MTDTTHDASLVNHLHTPPPASDESAPSPAAAAAVIDDFDCEECPLCFEELDITDRNFRPCACGYQICLWCFHNINEKADGKCPNCRSAYQQDAVVTKHLDPQVVQAAMEERKRKKELNRQKQQAAAAAAGMVTSLSSQSLSGVSKSANRDHLANVRIMQRNLVYVIGLPPQIAKEETLKRKDLFGKFGKIVKIAVNRKQTQGVNAQRPSCSAYITYRREEDAFEAIQNSNGQVMDGRILRATFGTTKYCSFFLRSVPCNNPNCLYLHELAADEDCFTKDDLSGYDKYTPFGGVQAYEAGFGPLQPEYHPAGAFSESGSRESSSSRDNRFSHQFSSIDSADENWPTVGSANSDPSLEATKPCVDPSSADFPPLSAHHTQPAAHSQNSGSSSGQPQSQNLGLNNNVDIVGRPPTPAKEPLHLPGLSSFGFGRSSSLGWTPAKEPDFRVRSFSDSNANGFSQQCSLPQPDHPSQRLRTFVHDDSGAFQGLTAQQQHQTNLLKGLLGIGPRTPPNAQPPSLNWDRTSVFQDSVLDSRHYQRAGEQHNWHSTLGQPQDQRREFMGLSGLYSPALSERRSGLLGNPSPHISSDYNSLSNAPPGLVPDGLNKSVESHGVIGGRSRTQISLSSIRPESSYYPMYNNASAKPGNSHVLFFGNSVDRLGLNVARGVEGAGQGVLHPHPLGLTSPAIASAAPLNIHSDVYTRYG